MITKHRYGTRITTSDGPDRRGGLCPQAENCRRNDHSSETSVPTRLDPVST